MRYHNEKTKWSAILDERYNRAIALLLNVNWLQSFEHLVTWINTCYLY